MMKRLPGKACLAATLALAGACAANAAELFVSPSGSDANPGTREAPFATIEKAQGAARLLKAKEGATVTLLPGTYRLSNPIELTKEDSGTEAAPFIVRGEPGASVCVSGGVEIPAFEPVTDKNLLRRLDPKVQGKLMQADLKKLGVADFGDYVETGWASSKGSDMELFYDGKPMTVARWPNGEWAKVEQMLGEPKMNEASRRTTWDSGAFSAPIMCFSRPDRLARWAEEPALKAYGYWCWDWASQRLDVASVDPDKGIIQLKNPESHTYGFKNGQRFYIYNALCELDEPGEWYVDRSKGILYFIPPETDSSSSAKAVVSVVSKPLLSIKDASDVIVKNIVFEHGRTDGAVISGGSRVRVESCVFRNLGLWAARIEGGTGNGVQGCDIYQVGAGGVHVSGGDRKTLVPGKNFASNNHIHDYARVQRVYKGGIHLDGVGNIASHNLIDNAPHSAMFFGGNDQLIEFNEIHSVCLETRDAGAIYAGRNWTCRGNVIRNNFIHHIQYDQVNGIYLDDQFSSAEITGNLFYKLSHAVFLSGGKDNKVVNNVFVDCVPAILADARGLNWQKKQDDGWLEEIAKKGTLSGIAFDKPPYSVRYPELVDIAKRGNPYAPEGNVIERNVCWGGKWNGINNDAKPFIKPGENLVDVDPLFIDAEKGDFRLKPESPAFKIGFKSVPLEQMGLVNDGRASWPVASKITEHAAELKTVKKPGKAAVFAVKSVSGKPVIDGSVDDPLWKQAEPPMLIEQSVEGAAKTQPASKAWLCNDGANLLVAVEVNLKPGNAIRPGKQWGQCDAVEIALANPLDGDKAQTIVLRGYASGSFESSEEAGASAKTAAKAAEGVEYASRIAGPQRWTAEWKIPFAAAGGIDLEQNGRAKLMFNITVRKASEELWQMWRSTDEAPSWSVDRTGFIEVER